MKSLALASSISLASLFAASGAQSVQAETLQPYQMVRSLQLVQDKIAGGDHAALPMQRKLLELIDARLRTSHPAEFEDERNYRALLVYGMSGGNPGTIEYILPRLGLEGMQADLGRGVTAYLRGRSIRAHEDLENVEPLSAPAEIGAFVALVKGSVTAIDQPEEAFRLFDVARLLGPGTLVEEAALRRTIGLSVDAHDPVRLASASEQYVRRFLHSPYAPQFASAFVEGVVALHKELDLDVINEIIGGMSGEQQKAIYLRIARRAVIEGYSDLLSFTREGLRDRESDPGSEDQREKLYSSIGTLTTGTVKEVSARLASIDRSKLAADDIQLLEAAETIAGEVTRGTFKHMNHEAGPPHPEPSVHTVGASDDPEFAAERETVDIARRKLESIDKLLESATP